MQCSLNSEVLLGEVLKDPGKYRKFLPNQVVFIIQLSQWLEYIYVTKTQ